MPLSSQSNPRKLQSMNTIRTIVEKKRVNRKKGTMKIKQFVIYHWSQSGYSNHRHIRTHFSGLRLIVFLFEGYVVRNQPESVLKMFLIKIGFRNTSNYILLKV